MKKTMFLNNVTAIDHAYIDDRGLVIGGSFTPKMLVAGKVDEKENVVVDFSGVKKSLKAIIDAKYSGFDHKLWIIEGWSECTWIKKPDLSVVVTTPYMTIEAPADAFKFVRSDKKYADVTPYISSSMDHIERELNEEMKMIYPKVDLEIGVVFEEEFTGAMSMNTDKVPFRYVHGLKDSSSWGCQNIAHGHYSYLAAAARDTFSANLLLRKIASVLDGKMFIWRDNVNYKPEGGLDVTYETERGFFKISTSKDYELYHTIVIPTETTVEHLADYIEQRWHAELTKCGVYALFVSEGLNKGAVAFPTSKE